MKHPSPPPHILLVEDDQAFRTVCTHKLEGAGYYVSAVGSAEEALEILRTNKPNLILLDLILPNQSGFDILEARMKDTVLSKIPVIVTSTLAQPSDQDRARQLGATDYITKESMDFPHLLQKIGNLLKYESQESSSSQEENFLPLFITNAKKHIETLERYVHILTEDVYDQKAMQEVARAFHNIRGMASLMGFTDLAKLCNEPELAFRKLTESKEYASSTFLHRTKNIIVQLKHSLNDIEENKSPHP